MVAVEDLVELRELDGSFTPGGLGAVGWSASEVYGGTVFLIRQSAAVRALVEKVQAVIRTEIGDDEPQSIHLKRAGADLLGAVKAAQQAVRSATDVQNLARALFEAAGFSPDSICLDGVYLRVQPPGPTHAGLPTAPLPSHRDCWTSNLYSQINWWAPVFSVTKGRTITFYPDYWSKPIPNTSQDWNLDEISARKAKAEAGDYPVLPAILEPVKSLNELRIIAEPGDIASFSGAHLHASVPNRTDETRFSLEMRTCLVDDVRQGVGAPNVDGEAPRDGRAWFKRLSDGKPLSELL